MGQSADGPRLPDAGLNFRFWQIGRHLCDAIDGSPAQIRPGRRGVILRGDLID
jgi:hypothetical protein